MIRSVESVGGSGASEASVSQVTDRTDEALSAYREMVAVRERIEKASFRGRRWRPISPRDAVYIDSAWGRLKVCRRSNGSWSTAWWVSTIGDSPRSGRSVTATGS